MADLHIKRVPWLSPLISYFGSVDRQIIAAEILFVAGWTMMWASSLQLIPMVSSLVWLGLMILGLLLATLFQR